MSRKFTKKSDTHDNESGKNLRDGTGAVPYEANDPAGA